MKRMIVLFAGVITMFVFQSKAQSPIPTAGLQLWLRADAGVDTLNGTVSRWHDQSGKGNDAIQLNSVRQPLFVDSVLNHKPVLRFDGVDDRLGFTGSTPMSQFTFFMVVKNNTPVPGQDHSDHVMGFGTPTGEGYFVLFGGLDRISDRIEIGSSAGGVRAVIPNIAAFGEWRLISIVTDQRIYNTTLRGNGIDATMTPNGGTNIPISIPMGTAGGIGGADNAPLGPLLTAHCDFAEAIVYDTLLTDSQRLAIERYLNVKYNIYIGVYDVQLAHPSRDTLRITARVQNTLGHDLKVTAILKDGVGSLLDSLSLQNDGLQGDGGAGDSLWGCTYAPTINGTIHVTIRTDDLTAGTSRTLADVSQIVFTRGALIALDASTTDLGKISNTMPHRDTTFTLRNIGFASDSLTLILDPINVIPETAVSVSPTSFFIVPGDSQKVTFNIQPQLLVPQYYQSIITVQPKSGLGQGSLSKSFTFQIVTASAVSTSTEMPKEFVLGQNFPNPFNPSTTIRYGLPNSSHVTLTVFNTLGQQVAILQNGEQEAGYHEVKFEGSGLSSGVYFYRIEAGSFVQTRKLLLIR